jgi:geranylgeranyl diphosphate synthase type I
MLFEVRTLSLEASIRRKLQLSAVKVDGFIDKLLVPNKPEEVYHAAHHLIKAGGKRLRPYLVLKTCELMGGDPELALPYAAAVEMFHTFTLVHDDIMDNDNLRRGSPTVHTKWGIPLAIVSGDLLFAKVYSAMLEPGKSGKMSKERVLSCLESLTNAAVILSEGQALDTLQSNVRDVSEEDYIHMVGGKTSSLFRTCAEVGCIVGGGSEEEVTRLGSFAWDAGIAFQIVDDILGVTADEATLGKPVGSDVREGKKTLITIKALEDASPEERRTLEKALGVPEASMSDIDEAIEVLASTGAIAYAEKVAAEYTEKAMAAIAVFPDSEAKRELVELVEYFTRRSY